MSGMRREAANERDKPKLIDAMQATVWRLPEGKGDEGRYVSVERGQITW